MQPQNDFSGKRNAMLILTSAAIFFMGLLYIADIFLKQGIFEWPNPNNILNFIPYIPILSILLIFFVSIFYHYIGMKKVRGEWSQVAMETGCQVTNTGVLRYPKIEGTYKGRKLDVHIIQKGSGRNKSNYTFVRVDFKYHNPVIARVDITKKHLFSFLSKKLFGDVIEMNSPDFNKKFQVRSKNEEYARQIIDDVVQGLLLDVKFSSIRVDFFVEGTRHGVVKNKDELRGFIEVLEKIASRIDRE